MKFKFITTALLTLMALYVNAAIEISTNCNVVDGFPVIASGENTNVYCDSTEVEVIQIASNLFCEDVERITTVKPELTHFEDSLSEYTIIIGTIDESKLIKDLIGAGKINVDDISGGWERFKIQTIDNPFAGVKKALVIAGSDRRGAAYGVFELSKSMGVSPFYWWADVTPKQVDSIVVCPQTYVSKEPTVKFRGIFINDEDWGLQEWSQYTYDPVKDIGPTTYAKVFELLLRLKANYIWPAMHPSTKPFNFYADNKVVADKYAILMGSSHHEPLLYNTEEWPYAKADWNPFTNMEGVMGELEKRVAANGSYENIYTVGIRGAGDGSVAGGSSLNDKTAKLEEVIDRQRDLLKTYVDADVTKVPQVFWPYKEVLDQYNNNMDLPDDITLGWVDDNHGYIRQVSNPTEQLRAGGSGVYYHLSYWGSPADYLWIASTQPALVASEMKKAAAYGGNRMWVFNVGDIKPAEMLMNFSLDLAWDYDKWNAQNANEYITEWAGYTFGEAFAEGITSVYKKYFQLCHAAKPEHINRVNFPDSEIEFRIASFEEIATDVEAIYGNIPADLKDAFFETVYYPIMGANYMNQKFLYAYKSFRAAVVNDNVALDYAKKAQDAFQGIKDITNHYNTGIKGGKWNKIISSDIRSQAVYDMPAVATQADLDKEYVELADINLAEGTFVAPMKYVNGVVYGNKAGVQTTTSGGKAEFTFELSKSITADIYFLAKTPTDTEDSWHINVNGTVFVQNNYVTGDNFEWINVRTGLLPAGANTITIHQREHNAQIAAIKISEPGLLQYSESYIAEPDSIISAWKFSNMTNASGYEWEVVDGLTTSEKGVMSAPITQDAVSDVSKAPYIEQDIKMKKQGVKIEVRCLPTRRLYEGRDLRIGISINDETPKIVSINKPYPTLEWEKNVLRGYVPSSVTHVSADSSINLKLYALDPDVVFDKVMLYYNESVAEIDTTKEEPEPNDIKENHANINNIKVYPNPFKDSFTCNFNNLNNQELELSIMDITGRNLVNKSISVTGENNVVQISTKELKSGNYFLKITCEGYSNTELLIKQ